VDFWDRTNRQDWAACESVQRGLSSPHFAPGPLAPSEDAVHQFVTMVARGYLGQPLTG
jgi:Rieske 2Fe-2S family protein